MYYLLQATLIPLLLSPLAYYITKKVGITVGTWFTFGIMVYSTIMLLIPSTSGYYYEEYNWNQFGNFGLLLDGLSIPFALVIYILSTVLVLYSKPYMLHKIEEEYQEEQRELQASPIKIISQVPKSIINREMGIYYALYLIFAMGMLGTVLATNLIEFYVFFEIMLVPSFFLIAFYGYGARRRIALMYLFWTHVGAVVLLLGIIAMGLSAGSFNMKDIKESKIEASLLPFIAIAIIIGLLVKLAIVPFHIWLPYAHAEAPTPISALLSPAMIGIGGYAIIRLVLTILPNTFNTLSIWLSIGAVVTMLYGGIMALMQSDVKRTLAYSSISQMGYMLFGIASLNPLSLTGSVLLFVSHGTGKALLFMMAGILIIRAHTRELPKLGGLAGKLPITAVSAFIGGLSIMGIPPSNGFMAEWFLFLGALNNALSSTQKIVIFSLAMIATALTMAYILWLIKRIFYGSLKEELEHIKEGSYYMLGPMIFLTILAIIIGIYPEPFINLITPYMKSILGESIVRIGGR